MRGPEGGSVHDPHANLPRPMWDRRTSVSKEECQACKDRKRPRAKRVLKVQGGPHPGSYLICPICDGTAGAVPEELRSG